MFSSFFRSRTSSAAPVKGDIKAKDVDSDDGSADSEDARISLDLQVEAGSGKGWPESATVVLYHRVQGLICVGTEGGSIYVFGDGFQFVRPWLTNDPNGVVSLVAVYPNKVLAAFADNSIAVMELPSLNIIDLLPSAWLGSKEGDITSIFSDIVSEKPFVFVGTSHGNVHVLDVMESAVRLCDPVLTLQDWGLSPAAGFLVADLHLSPKDERYLAVALDAAAAPEAGVVVVFDLAKHKLHKTVKLPGVTSLAWHHAGDVLYAGSASGKLYAVQVDRGTSVECWQSGEERLDEDDGEAPPPIRRVDWLGPQPSSPSSPSSSSSSSTTAPSEGCLFLLLASPGLDNDNLKTVLLGLSPAAAGPGGGPCELQLALSLPPLPGEKVVNFRLVPSHPRGGGGPVTPALLLLTQEQREETRHLVSRQLRLLRCPAGPLADWPLEMGALPDPRPAREVLPADTPITSVLGLLPDFSNPLSLGRALLDAAIQDDGRVVHTGPLPAPAPALGDEDDETTDERVATATTAGKRASRRLSARAFFSSQAAAAAAAAADRWEVVLAAGQHEEHVLQGEDGDRAEEEAACCSGRWRQQDVVFLGAADGSLLAYGVSLPAGSAAVGRGSVWLPLAALRPSAVAVTCLAADAAVGLLLAADAAGGFSLYELRDPASDLTASDVANQVHVRLQAEADILSAPAAGGEGGGAGGGTADPPPLLHLDAFSEAQVSKQLLLYDNNAFSKLSPVYRNARLPSRVTAALLRGALQRVFLGCEDGGVYACQDLRSSLFVPWGGGAGTGGTYGAVRGLCLAYLLVGAGLVPVLYAYHASGHLQVLDALRGGTLAVWTAPAVLEAVRDLEEEGEGGEGGEGEGEGGGVGEMWVFQADQRLAPPPATQALLYLQARARRAARGDASPSSSSVPGPASTTSTSSSASPPPPEEPKRRSFFGSRAASKPAAASPPPPPPPALSASSSLSSVSPPPPPCPSSSVRLIDFSLGQVPTRLAVAHGRHLLTFDLRRLGDLLAASSSSSRASSTTSSRRGEGGAAAGLSQLSELAAAVSVKALFPSPLVGGALLSLRPSHRNNNNRGEEEGEEEEEEGGGRVELVGGVGRDGALQLVRPLARQAALPSPVCLTEGLAEEAALTFQAASLLPNGSAYLVQRGGRMIFTSSLRSNSGRGWAAQPPDRASPFSVPLESAAQLGHGREAWLAAGKAAAKKRRSSVLTLTAAPPDLYKLFAKTREARLKDDLLLSRSTTAEEDEATTTAATAGKRAGRATSRLLGTEMAQLRDNLEDRGEKINRIVLKMESFKQSAADFRATARAQKEQLQRKNERWGLF